MNVRFFSSATLRQLVGEDLAVRRIRGAGRFPGFWRSASLVAAKFERGRRGEG